MKPKDLQAELKKLIADAKWNLDAAKMESSNLAKRGAAFKQANINAQAELRQFEKAITRLINEVEGSGGNASGPIDLNIKPENVGDEIERFMLKIVKQTHARKAETKATSRLDESVERVRSAIMLFNRLLEAVPPRLLHEDATREEVLLRFLYALEGLPWPDRLSGFATSPAVLCQIVCSDDLLRFAQPTDDLPGDSPGASQK